MWRFVAQQGLPASAAGAGVGLMMGYAIARTLTNLLLGMSPSDPRVYLAVAATLIVIASCAVVIPARSVTRQNLVGILEGG